MIMFGRILRFVERNQLANWLFEMITCFGSVSVRYLALT